MLAFEVRNESKIQEFESKISKKKTKQDRIKND
jgi:hypothetical protein